jgi:uncharacterized protein (TIGR02118 family)
VVKSIFVFSRKAGLSLAEFSSYWLDTHAAIALELPGVRGYTQSHRIADELGNAPYDGFATFLHDDEEAAMAALDSPEAARAAADAGGFVDPASVRHFLALGIVMRELPTSLEMVKVVFFFHRKVGTSPEQFRRHWLEVHGPLAMKHIAGLRHYVQNHTLDSCYADGDPTFDGLVEAWVDDLDALAEIEASDEHAFVRSDEANFLDVSRVTFVPVREHVVL